MLLILLRQWFGSFEHSRGRAGKDSSQACDVLDEVIPPGNNTLHLVVRARYGLLTMARLLEAVVTAIFYKPARLPWPWGPES